METATNLTSPLPVSSTVLAVIELIKRAIENGENEKVTKYLSQLTLGANIDVGRVNRFMVDLLNLSYTSNNIGATLAITEVWAGANIMEERFSTIGYIFTLDGLPNEFFRFFIQLFPTLAYSSLIAEFIKQDSSPEILRACQRADVAFGPQEIGVFNVLAGLINQQEVEEGVSNTTVKQFIVEHLRELNPANPKPTWVRDFRVDKSLPLPYDDQLERPTVGDIRFALPNTKKAAELLTGGLRFDGLDKEKIEEIKQAIIQEYSLATIEEKVEMLRPVFTIKAKYDLHADVELFRVLGPANPLYGTDFSGDSVCSKYGGCRMLTCLEFENADDDIGFINDENYDGVEWFTGSCAECLKKIDAKHYAVRRPMIQGGWWGCYCSWKCTINNMTEPMPLIREMIKKIEKQLDEIGIQDRQYRPDETPVLEALPTVNDMIEAVTAQLIQFKAEIPTALG